MWASVAPRWLRELVLGLRAQPAIARLLEAWDGRRAATLGSAVLLLVVFGLGVVALLGSGTNLNGHFPPVEQGEGTSLVVEVSAVAGDAFTPLEGASVRVLVADDKGAFRERPALLTDAAGKVEFPRLPVGQAWVLVDAPGHARASRELSLFADHRLLFRLHPASKLAVTVVDEENLPIQGATVLVDDVDPLPFGGLTDAQGLAVFDRLSPPPFHVEVHARGYESVELDDIKADQRVVLRRLGSLLVHVIDSDGDPAKQAQVLIVGSSLFPARRTVTDDKGDVTITGLFAGTYNLRAHLGSKVSPELSGIALEKAEHKRVELRLNAARTVRVLVVDESPGYDEPIKGAQVVLAEYGISSFPASATTGEDGIAFLSPVPLGPSFVSVSAEGFVSRSVVAVPAETTEPVRVALMKGATLLGEVTDPEGRPIEGARVEVIGTDMDGMPIAQTPLLAAYQQAHFQFSLRPPQLLAAGELGITVGPVPYVTEALSGQAFTALPEDYSPWLSDYEGDFRCFPVSPGRVRALVRHPSYVEGVSDEVTLGPGGEAKVKVVLEPGGELIGRVVDESGRPVPLARVSVMATRGSFQRTTYAQEDGTFGFAAVPTEVTIALSRPDDPTRYVLRVVQKVKGGAVTEVELVLPSEREPTEVRVFDSSDRPIELAQVQFTSLDPAIPLRASRFTDSTGQTALDDTVGLQVRVDVTAPGYLPWSKQYKEVPDEIDVTLQRGIKVEGRVTAVRGRLDAVGARVSLNGNGRRDTTYTDASGKYHFDNVPLGVVKLTIHHDEYARAEREFTVEDTGREDRAFEVADIDLAEASVLSGIVVDEQGLPIRGARVGLGFAPAYLAGGQLPEGFVLTDAEGRFELRSVEPGEHTIAVAAPGFERGAIDVQVSEGSDQSELRVALREGDAEGELNLAGGSVALTLGERDTASGVDVVISDVAAGGEAERAGLRAGDIVVKVDAQRAKNMKQARRLLDGRVGSDVVIDVTRGGEPLAFRVRRESVAR